MHIQCRGVSPALCGAGGACAAAVRARAARLPRRDGAWGRAVTMRSGSRRRRAGSSWWPPEPKRHGEPRGAVVPPPGIEPSDRASQTRVHLQCRGASPRLTARVARPSGGVADRARVVVNRAGGATPAAEYRPVPGRLRHTADAARRRVAAPPGPAAVPGALSLQGRAAAGSRTPSHRLVAGCLTSSASAARASGVRVAGFEPATFCSQGRRAGLAAPHSVGRAAPPHAGRRRGPTGSRTLNSCLQGRCDPVSPSARRVPVAAAGSVENGRGAAHGLCCRPPPAAGRPRRARRLGNGSFRKRRVVHCGVVFIVATNIPIPAQRPIRRRRTPI